MIKNQKESNIGIQQSPQRKQLLFYKNDPQHASIIQLPFWTNKIKRQWEQYPSIGKYIAQEATKLKEKVDKSLSSAYERTKKSIEGIREQIAGKLGRYAWRLIGIPLILLILTTVLYCSIKSYCLWKTKRVTKDVIAMSKKASPLFLKKMRKQLLEEMVNNVYLDESAMKMPELKGNCSQNEKSYYIPETYSIICNINGRCNELPYIETVINNKRYKALVDSGASVSYLGTTTLKSLGVDQLANKEHVQARTANGAAFTFLTSVKLRVKIGNHQYEHTFRISKDDACPAPILVGSDFIKTIHYAGQTLTMGLVNRKILIGQEVNPLIQVNATGLEANNVTNNKLKVRLSQTFTLEKRTETIVSAQVEDYSYQKGKQINYLIEDNNRKDDHAYVVRRALVTPDEYGVTVVIIMNPSNPKVKLYGNTYIADAYSVEQDYQIYAVNSEQIYVTPEVFGEQRLPIFRQPHRPEYNIATEIDLLKANLSEEQKQHLRNIIRKHKNAFVGSDGAL